jgi:hypothetical protein
MIQNEFYSSIKSQEQFIEKRDRRKQRYRRLETDDRYIVEIEYVDLSNAEEKENGDDL